MGNERVRLITLIAVFAVALLGIQVTEHRREVHQDVQPDWSAVPYDLNGWSGTDGKFDPVYGTDPADTSLLRIYHQGEKPPVIAYVGFYSDLVKILEVHTPEICYTAQGWTLLSTSKSVAGTYRGRTIPASNAVVDKGGNDRLVTWWYNAGAHPFETRIRYVTGMLALSTLTGQKNGSMVRLETPFRPGEADAARAAMLDFRKDFLPALDKALPR